MRDEPDTKRKTTVHEDEMSYSHSLGVVGYPKLEEHFLDRIIGLKGTIA
jgi:hypothetical protein